MIIISLLQIEKNVTLLRHKILFVLRHSDNDYLTRDYYSGFIDERGNMIRLKDGGFTQNPPHFAGHSFIKFHFNQPTEDYYLRVYLRLGKCGSGKIWRNHPEPATLYRS